MLIDHTCPVAWGAEHGLLGGSPVEATWCFSYRFGALMMDTPPDAKSPELLLWKDHRLSVYYTPFDWVNTSATVMLVGITPGFSQATEAIHEARRCLQKGKSEEDTLRSVDAAASFVGPMRTNLVRMLDEIHLAPALGLDTTAQLFGDHHHLAAHVSAIDFPVYINGKNYSGSSPELTKHPVLRSLVRACLGPRVQMASKALIVPLGARAQDGVQLLIDSGLLDRRRCLLGFPHPSGGNGHRVRLFTERREALREGVVAWAGACR